MSNFSEQLVTLRKARGLSQAQVAKAVHVAPRAYQNYEYDEAEPRLSTLIRLADFYQVSLDDLVGRPFPVSKPSAD